MGRMKKHQSHFSPRPGTPGRGVGGEGAIRPLRRIGPIRPIARLHF